MWRFITRPGGASAAGSGVQAMGLVSVFARELLTDGLSAVKCVITSDLMAREPWLTMCESDKPTACVQTLDLAGITRSSLGSYSLSSYVVFEVLEAAAPADLGRVRLPSRRGLHTRWARVRSPAEVPQMVDPEPQIDVAQSSAARD